MKEYFVYTSMSGEEHRIDIEKWMKERNELYEGKYPEYQDKVLAKRFLMGFIGKNKHFEEV